MAILDSPDVAKPINPALIEALDQRVLRYFLAVVRAGSIRGGADAVNVTPSAISRQISELEAICGHLLLERLTRGVAPTEAGRAVADFARRQVEQAEQLLDRLQQMEGIRQSTVRLWCGDGLVRDLLSNGLPEFLRRHPHISVKLTSATTDEILVAVQEGDADLGLSYETPVHPDIERIRSSHRPLLAILHPSHPLARQTSLRLRAFADEPTAAPPRSTTVRQLLGRIEESEGFRLTVSFETMSHEAMRLFVGNGLGVTFLPAYCCETELDRGTLVSVGLDEASLSETSVQLLVRARRRLPVAVDLLAQSLSNHMHAFTRSDWTAGAGPPDDVGFDEEVLRTRNRQPE